MDDTKLRGVVDTLEGRDDTPRDCDRIERWPMQTRCSSTRPSAGDLHLNQGNPKHEYSLGNEWMESSPTEKDLEILVDEKLVMTQ